MNVVSVAKLSCLWLPSLHGSVRITDGHYHVWLYVVSEDLNTGFKLAWEGNTFLIQWSPQLHTYQSLNESRQ